MMKKTLKVTAWLLSFVLLMSIIPVNLTAYYDEDYVLEEYPEYEEEEEIAFELTTGFVSFSGTTEVSNWDELEFAITHAPIGELLTIVLENDIIAPEPSTRIAIPTGTDIALTSTEGKNFSIMQTTQGERHFFISSDSILRLYNVTITGDRHNLPPDHNHGGIMSEGGPSVPGGHLIMEEGSSIINMRHAEGILAIHFASFTMYGGIISNNISIDESTGLGTSPVVIGGSSKFIMDEGLITQNEGLFGGGVMLVTTEAIRTQLVMNGGEISHNTGHVGGAVFSLAGLITINSGRIENNTTLSSGGGISMLQLSILNMHGGYIHNNNALGNAQKSTEAFYAAFGFGFPIPMGGGGVIALWSSEINIFNGMISDNFTPANGGGLLIDGESDEWPYAPFSSITMHNGDIIGNIGYHGGGIHAAVEDLNNITISPSATLTNNIAEAGMFPNNTLAVANTQINPNTVSVAWLEANSDLQLATPHAFTNYDITATNSTQFYRVTHEVAGGTGTITATAGANNLTVPSGHFVPTGTEVSFTVAPASGSKLDNWQARTRATEAIAATGTATSFSAFASYGDTIPLSRAVNANTNVRANLASGGGTGGGSQTSGGGNGVPSGGSVSLSVNVEKNNEVEICLQPEIITGVHLLYITGYPDGTFKPNNNITRAEIAGIVARIDFEDFPRGVLHSVNFPDVTGNEWFASYLGFAQQRGLVTGYPNGEYKPQNTLTRAEFATLMVRFIGLTPIGADAFPDTTNHWAAGYINALVVHGAITGYEDGTFRPDSPITRAEAVTLVNRILERGVNLQGLANVQYRTFPDIAGHWAYFDIIEASNSHSFSLIDDNEIWDAIWFEIWWFGE